jgi:hypothetical protein
MANNDYYSQIAELRKQRHQREAVERVNEIVREHSEVEKERDEAARENDVTSYEYWDGQAEALEAEFSKLRGPPGLSNEKQAFIAKRWDIPHTPETIKTANAAHHYLVNILGYADDSPQYFDGMKHYLEPAGYQPPATADDVVKMCGIDAKTYNRNARKIYNLKSAGQYRDR